MDTPHFTEPASRKATGGASLGTRILRTEDVLEPMEVMTIWLAIDPSTRVNGCMKVIPGTHQHGFSDYEEVTGGANVFGTEIVPSQRDDSKVVYLELQRNQASLHDGRIIHGSDPTRATSDACGYTMRYISTRTCFHAEANEVQGGTGTQGPLSDPISTRGALMVRRYGAPTRRQSDIGARGRETDVQGTASLPRLTQG